MAIVTQKTYLLAGLLLMGAAVVLANESNADILAFTGLLALALGLMQVYVALPGWVKTAAVVSYLAGVAGFARGGKRWETAGGVLVLLALAAQAVGVLRFSKKD